MAFDNSLIHSLEFLLDKEWVENFFNEKSEIIFGDRRSIKLISLERAVTLAPESYILLYKLEVNGEEISVRGSASTKDSREQFFKTHEYLYNHGFDNGDLLVAKPYHYFKDINLMLYLDVPGRTLINELGGDLDKLENKVLLAARALKKIHELPRPEFIQNGPAWQYDEKVITDYFPDFKEKYNLIEDSIKNLSGEISLCHGDFQVNNLIAGSDKLYVIDFGSACLAEKELDLASFISQLHIMLKRFGHAEYFEVLEKTFLNEYGEYNQENYYIYSNLFGLQILSTMIAFFRHEEETEYIKYWHDFLLRS